MHDRYGRRYNPLNSTYAMQQLRMTASKQAADGSHAPSWERAHVRVQITAGKLRDAGERNVLVQPAQELLPPHFAAGHFCTVAWLCEGATAMQVRL